MNRCTPVIIFAGRRLVTNDFTSCERCKKVVHCLTLNIYIRLKRASSSKLLSLINKNRYNI